MTRKKFLFIPIMPTPNGRLHIGHISGPYLKSDILARNLRLLGHDAKIISGVDTYEAHVCLKAYQEGLTPEEVNDKYHALMLDDLKAFGIEFDAFINPLDREHNDSFKDLHHRLFKVLSDNGCLEYLEEEFFKRDDGKVINGCWIRGVCPNCAAGMKAFYCEECGANLRPEEIKDPYFIPELKDDESVAVIKEFCSYIKVDAEQLEKKWAEMDLDSNFINIARTFLKKEGNKVRLTAPDEWGIEVRDDKYKQKQIMFSYTIMHFFSVYCAALYQNQYKSDVAPFDPASDVITIAGFGVDNTNAYLVAFLGAAYGLGIKPFDYFITNYFFQLDHRKIASSSGHAIWAEDLVNVYNYDSDAARMYITQVNPQFQQRNFTLEEFDLFNNEVYLGKIRKKIDSALMMDVNNAPEHVSLDLSEKFAKLFSEQQADFSFPTPVISKALESIYHWLDEYDVDRKYSKQEVFDWLVGLSLLTHSIAPKISAEIAAHVNMSSADMLGYFNI